MFRIGLILALFHALLTGHHSAGAPLLICSGGAMVVKFIGPDGEAQMQEPCGPCCLVAMSLDLPNFGTPHRLKIAMQRVTPEITDNGAAKLHSAIARSPPLA